MMVNGICHCLLGKMGVESGEVPAYPLRRRNVAGLTFLTKLICFNSEI